MRVRGLVSVPSWEVSRMNGGPKIGQMTPFSTLICEHLVPVALPRSSACEFLIMRQVQTSHGTKEWLEPNLLCGVGRTSVRHALINITNLTCKRKVQSMSNLIMGGG